VIKVALQAGGRSYAPAIARANSAWDCRLAASLESHCTDRTSPRKSVSNAKLLKGCPAGTTAVPTAAPVGGVAVII